MINFVTVREKQLTHEKVQKRLGPEQFRLVAYEDLLTSRAAAGGTWIFSDFDRLRPSELREAIRVHRRLKAAGCKVLNDPARVLQRAALLKALYEDGVNSFRTWRLADGERPNTFPVFLRGQSEHFGPLSDLLYNPEEVDSAIEAELATGTTSLHDLIAVEYRAETLDGTRFRKLSAHRIGDAIFPGMVIINTHWRAKEGTLRIATEEDYAREKRDFENFPWTAAVRGVFERANIEYGRVDFSIVGGRPEFYEINTNPMNTEMLKHWSETKFAVYRSMVARYNEAMLALDANALPASETIDLGLPEPKPPKAPKPPKPPKVVKPPKKPLTVAQRARRKLGHVLGLKQKANPPNTGLPNDG